MIDMTYNVYFGSIYVSSFNKQKQLSGFSSVNMDVSLGKIKQALKLLNIEAWKIEQDGRIIEMSEFVRKDTEEREKERNDHNKMMVELCKKYNKLPRVFYKTFVLTRKGKMDIEIVRGEAEYNPKWSSRLQAHLSIKIKKGTATEDASLYEFFSDSGNIRHKSIKQRHEDLTDKEREKLIEAMLWVKEKIAKIKSDYNIGR